MSTRNNFVIAKTKTSREIWVFEAAPPQPQTATKGGGGAPEEPTPSPTSTDGPRHDPGTCR